MKYFSAVLAAIAIVLLTGNAAIVLAHDGDLADGQSAVQCIAVDTGVVLEPLDPTVASGAKAIRIFLEAQKAYLTESGVVVRSFRISSGAPDTPTPLGDFRIYRKQELRISSQAVRYRMPNYMSFTKNSAFGLHALPYLGKSAGESAYWNEAFSHIGTPVSHGCIRFLPEEAAEIYDWADVGVPVYIQS